MRHVNSLLFYYFVNTVLFPAMDQSSSLPYI